MPRQCCFLCASDEGAFLDITADNKQVFHKQFEICSLVKVPTGDQLPTKLCHKCAYELNQCSSFVQRFKRIAKQKLQNRKPCCSLCHQPAKDDFIFDLSKDQNLQHNSFDKIRKVFDYDIKNLKEDHKFICLSCRYTLDVLSDLKNVSEEAAVILNDITNEKVDYVNIPKIKTIVVSRKTTITESARINLPTLQESNSNSTITTRTRSQNNKLGIDDKSNGKRKPHSSGEGKRIAKREEIEANDYKQCSDKSDFAKSEVENQIPQNVTEAKVCKVFLKDVLKDTELKEQKLNVVNKNGQGNKTYAARKRNVEIKTKSDNINNTRNGVSKQSQKRSITDVKDENNQTNNEPTLTKRSRVTIKQESDDSKEPESTHVQTRHRKATSSAQNFDSDSSISTRKSERTLTRQKRTTGASLSDADIESKRNRRKLRSILEGNAVIKSLELADESSSNDDVVPRKKQRFASTSPILTTKRSKRIAKKETTSQSPKHVPEKHSRSTRQSKRSQESQSSESDNEVVVFDTTTYICDECGASYENRLLGLTHKLTHYKQPKIELKKVKKKEVIKEVSDTSETDEQCKDQSETVAIRVDDDEEEPVKDTSSLIENNMDDKTQDSKKEAMEDAVDMELVMKESDDDCSQTERKTDELEKKEEEKVDTVLLDSPTQDESEDNKQSRSSYDNNNDTYESVEKGSINIEETQNTSLSNIDDKEEEKQDALSKNTEAVQKEQSEEKDKEEQVTEESEDKVNDDNEKEDKDAEEKVARTERKDSSEEEVISLGIWEENEGVNDTESQKNSNNDIIIDEIDLSKDDKRNSVGKKAEKNEVELVEINKLKSPECTKKRRSSEGKKDQSAEMNNTSAKPIIVEDIVLSDKSISLDEKDSETDAIKVSKSDVSEQEEPNDCTHAAAEVLQEVIDLASAEVQKRQDVTEIDNEDNSNDAETLENISREIRNSVEVPNVE